MTYAGTTGAPGGAPVTIETLLARKRDRTPIVMVLHLQPASAIIQMLESTPRILESNAQTQSVSVPAAEPRSAVVYSQEQLV